MAPTENLSGHVTSLALTSGQVQGLALARLEIPEDLSLSFSLFLSLSLSHTHTHTHARTRIYNLVLDLLNVYDLE